MSSIVDDAYAGVQSCLLMLVAKKLSAYPDCAGISAKDAIKAWVIWRENDHHKNDDGYNPMLNLEYQAAFGSHMAAKFVFWTYVADAVDNILMDVLSTERGQTSILKRQLSKLDTMLGDK